MTKVHNIRLKDNLIAVISSFITFLCKPNGFAAKCSFYNWRAHFYFGIYTSLVADWPSDLNTSITPPNTKIPFNLSHTFTPIHFHSSYTHNLLFQVYPPQSQQVWLSFTPSYIYSLTHTWVLHCHPPGYHYTICSFVIIGWCKSSSSIIINNTVSHHPVLSSVYKLPTFI